MHFLTHVLCLALGYFIGKRQFCRVGYLHNAPYNPEHHDGRFKSFCGRYKLAKQPTAPCEQVENKEVPAQ